MLMMQVVSGKSLLNFFTVFNDETGNPYGAKRNLR
nr:hypothetical protein [Mucilaginibacter sp. FT3.2]